MFSSDNDLYSRRHSRFRLNDLQGAFCEQHKHAEPRYRRYHCLSGNAYFCIGSVIQLRLEGHLQRPGSLASPICNQKRRYKLLQVSNSNSLHRKTYTTKMAIYDGNTNKHIFRELIDGGDPYAHHRYLIPIYGSWTPACSISFFLVARRSKTLGR